MRDLDSRNPTHYLLPCFKTISAPKKGTRNYEERVKTSLVCEFIRIQLEDGKETISDSLLLLGSNKNGQIFPFTSLIPRLSLLRAQRNV